ncbi:MAG: PilZ domain-containing protein [Myxococcaceae bacterium]
MASNRRRHQRVKPKQLISRVQGGDALHIGLVVENLSVGGAFVRCASPMRVGTRVKLELQRPGAPTPITVAGVVASALNPAQAAERKVSAGMGIAFDAMPPHVEARIEGIIGASNPEALKVTVDSSEETNTAPVRSSDELPLVRPRAHTSDVLQRPPTREGIPVQAPTPSQPMRAIAAGGLSPEVSAQLNKLLRQVSGFAEELAKKDREIDRLRAENQRLKEMMKRGRP